MTGCPLLDSLQQLLVSPFEGAPHEIPEFKLWLHQSLVEDRKGVIILQIKGETNDCM